GCQSIDVAFTTKNEGHLGIAEMCGGLDERIENRLELGDRAADDLEHIGGGGLLLQRFTEIARARLHLVEQPYVLDRNHRLVGEGLDQLDLFVGKWSHDRAVHDEHTNRSSLPQERHTEHCAKAALFLNFNKGVFRIG